MPKPFSPNEFACVIDHTTDIPTLSNLISACPAAKEAFQQCSRSSIESALRDLPKEFRQLAAALVAAYTRKPEDFVAIDTFLGKHLSHNRNVFPETIPAPVEVLKKLSIAWTAVEELSIAFAGSCQEALANINRTKALGRAHVGFVEVWESLNPGLPWPAEATDLGLPDEHITLSGRERDLLPFTELENYRIKRALWRFELYCALFHHFGSNERGPRVYRNFHEDGLPRYGSSYDACPHIFAGQWIFLRSLQPWEIEEIATIYHFLSGMLENVYRQDLLKIYSESRSHQQDESIQPAETQFAKRDLLRRISHQMSLGLPFLNRVNKQISEDGGKVNPDLYPKLVHATDFFFPDALRLINNGLWEEGNDGSSLRPDYVEIPLEITRRWSDMGWAQHPSDAWMSRRYDKHWRDYVELRMLPMGVDADRAVGFFMWDYPYAVTG
ncbi:hypothetical protein MMC28_008922 [Mycoblastus sanguinarius]|nr:hypothetical protein [Mycoblastus sanguinarius]